MTVKVGDFVTINASGEKGRLMGIYPATDGATLYVKTPAGDRHIDMPLGKDADDYLTFLPKGSYHFDCT